jgi:hypothetical protein
MERKAAKRYIEVAIEQATHQPNPTERELLPTADRFNALWDRLTEYKEAGYPMIWTDGEGMILSVGNSTISHTEGRKGVIGAIWFVEGHGREAVTEFLGMNRFDQGSARNDPEAIRMLGLLEESLAEAETMQPYQGPNSYEIESLVGRIWSVKMP